LCVHTSDKWKACNVQQEKTTRGQNLVCAGYVRH